MNDSDSTNADTSKLKSEQSSASDTKPVLTLLKPTMSHEQMRKNLVANLKKSGFKIVKSKTK
jgi:hypothetical protein